MVALISRLEMGQNQSTFDSDTSLVCSEFKYEPLEGSKLKVLPLESLPTELCLQILSKLDINTLLKMARVSKHWNRLANQDIIFQKATASRFKVHASRFPYLCLDPCETKHKWRDIYKEMDSGVSTWTGFAMDYVTNQGNPYEMELIVKSAHTKLVRGPAHSNISNFFFRLSQFQGCCRWKTLADSLTYTTGAIVDPEGNSALRFDVDPFLNAYIPRHITFTETGVVRGLDLLVPNVYQGLVCSNVVLGSYDPGHPDLVGSFLCVLQDSIPLDRNYSSKFRRSREYTGIWMTSADKAIYMSFLIESVSSDTVLGTVILYPYVACRRTTRSAKVELEKSVNLQFQFQFNSSDHKYLHINNGRFSVIASSFYNQVWVQECVPVMQEIHLSIFGDTITGIFSNPRPGCFYLNPIN